jgi:hypothetical protein
MIDHFTLLVKDVTYFGNDLEIIQSLSKVFGENKIKSIEKVMFKNENDAFDFIVEFIDKEDSFIVILFLFLKFTIYLFLFFVCSGKNFE